MESEATPAKLESTWAFKWPRSALRGLPWGWVNTDIHLETLKHRWPSMCRQGTIPRASLALHSARALSVDLLLLLCILFLHTKQMHVPSEILQHFLKLENSLQFKWGSNASLICLLLFYTISWGEVHLLLIFILPTHVSFSANKWAGNEVGFGIRQTWIQIPALPQTHFLTWQNA